MTDTEWPICPHCEREFRYDKGKDGTIPPPSCCGWPFCRAREDWTSEQWQGKARMARARRDAGIPVNEWDEEALSRETP